MTNHQNCSLCGKPRLSKNKICMNPDCPLITMDENMIEKFNEQKETTKFKIILRSIDRAKKMMEYKIKVGNERMVFFYKGKIIAYQTFLRLLLSDDENLKIGIFQSKAGKHNIHESSK